MDTGKPQEFDCYTQFEYCMRCAGLPNQVNSFYRYGRASDCTRQWDNFYFCLEYAWKPEALRMAVLRDRRRVMDKSASTTVGTIWNLRSSPLVQSQSPSSSLNGGDGVVDGAPRTGESMHTPFSVAEVQVGNLQGGCPHKHSSSSTSSASGDVPAACKSAMSAAYDTRATTPLSTIVDDQHSSSQVSFNPDNQSYSNDNRGDAALPVQRKVSSIPRTADDEHKDKDQEYWVYPSQQQFYNSMRRKNFEPSEDDMALVVSMHNAVNEMTWRKVMQWEAKYMDTCAKPTLKKFGGKSEEISPKARLMSWLGYSLPFDRHDWVVDRCGVEVPYIIDFYTGDSRGGSAVVAMHIDARPRLDSVGAAYDRVERWFKSFFS